MWDYRLSQQWIWWFCSLLWCDLYGRLVPRSQSNLLPPSTGTPTWNMEEYSPHKKYYIGDKVKVKAVPLQAWSGPEGSRKLRFPDYMTTAQDDGKVGPCWCVYVAPFGSRLSQGMWGGSRMYLLWLTWMCSWQKQQWQALWNAIFLLFYSCSYAKHVNVQATYYGVLSYTVILLEWQWTSVH
jgi:hypothetical protein